MFYTLIKTWIFYQSEHVLGTIYILKEILNKKITLSLAIIIIITIIIIF